MTTDATSMTAVTSCYLCEKDPAVRKLLDYRDRCEACGGRYSPAEVKSLLRGLRWAQGHRASSEPQFGRLAEIMVVDEVVRTLAVAGVLREVEISAIVNHLGLGQTQDDVAGLLEVDPRTILRATKSGVAKVTRALNGQDPSFSDEQKRRLP